MYDLNVTSARSVRVRTRWGSLKYVRTRAQHFCNSYAAGVGKLRLAIRHSASKPDVASDAKRKRTLVSTPSGSVTT
eukprot:8424274-Pyramimonas_sp.AAC.1